MIRSEVGVLDKTRRSPSREGSHSQPFGGPTRRMGKLTAQCKTSYAYQNMATLASKPASSQKTWTVPPLIATSIVEIHQEFHVATGRRNHNGWARALCPFVRNELYTYIRKKNTNERVFTRAPFTRILV